MTVCSTSKKIQAKRSSRQYAVKYLISVCLILSCSNLKLTQRYIFSRILPDYGVYFRGKVTTNYEMSQNCVTLLCNNAIEDYFDVFVFPDFCYLR